MGYVIVKYGANKEKLVNPNCLGAVLLGHIKKSCGYNDLVESVDLASESGEVMDLISRPREYARKFLESRASYILVKVIGDESDDFSPTYIPLLDMAGEKVKFSVTNPTFKMRGKSKAGGKNETPKPEKIDEAPSMPSLPKVNKSAQPTKPTKNEKADPKMNEKSAPVPAPNVASTMTTPMTDSMQQQRTSFSICRSPTAVPLDSRTSAKKGNKQSNGSTSSKISSSGTNDINSDGNKKGK
ncbi:hypothetical protein BASA50_011293 [Batrachochytrium salamandrivorans]|uniref:Uncharacterized protein n=1 Tax=Batrachochytrium salamandrivorans TaxID=1357716 RepID=A0ABQ8EZ66_9FUNG|nr:hypothetical protein BASA60_007859 [Batrachochytrium salamandrivorans]KAH6574942.1 hypothetical protein BASA62_002202 [Batrachochytrium salamandrivorans]KAH6587689.1 hypothetical protein BASA50_011293 [Batrachochytrium salamandrivorans]